MALRIFLIWRQIRAHPTSQTSAPNVTRIAMYSQRSGAKQIRWCLECETIVTDVLVNLHGFFHFSNSPFHTDHQGPTDNAMSDIELLNSRNSNNGSNIPIIQSVTHMNG